MKRLLFSGFASLVMAALLVGCGSKDQPAETGGAHPMDTMQHEMQHDAGSAAKAAEALGAAAVTAADKTLMAAQGTCPVSGEDLESQEAPVKLDYEGKTVFFCCEDCVAQFKKSPTKYLAKLKH